MQRPVNKSLFEGIELRVGLFYWTKVMPTEVVQ